MGFHLLGINIDIPFKSTLEGVGNGIGHLMHGDIIGAAKATLKGMANDTTGQLLLCLFPPLGLTAKAVIAGGLALTAADATHMLDNPEDQQQGQQRQQIQPPQFQTGGSQW